MKLYKTVFAVSMVLLMINCFGMDAAREEGIKAWLSSVVDDVVEDLPKDARGIGIGLDRDNPAKVENLHCEGVSASVFLNLGRLMQKQSNTSSESK